MSLHVCNDKENHGKDGVTIPKTRGIPDYSILSFNGPTELSEKDVVPPRAVAFTSFCDAAPRPSSDLFRVQDGRARRLDLCGTEWSGVFYRALPLPAPLSIAPDNTLNTR